MNHTVEFKQKEPKKILVEALEAGQLFTLAMTGMEGYLYKAGSTPRPLGFYGAERLKRPCVNLSSGKDAFIGPHLPCIPVHIVQSTFVVEEE